MTLTKAIINSIKENGLLTFDNMRDAQQEAYNYVLSDFNTDYSICDLYEISINDLREIQQVINKL